MDILVSNDDGVEAAGIIVLAKAMKKLGSVVVSAPMNEQSAKSHSLTMREPVRVVRRPEGWYGVGGTPADSVYMALHHLCSSPPDWVVSGINAGGNLGDDVVYSGTVAAAREAALNGIPSLAVSLVIAGDTPHWETAAEISTRVIEMMSAEKLPKGTFLNLNIPDRPLSDVVGLAVTSLGNRHYKSEVDRRQDPRGHAYYWIGGPPDGFSGSEHSDGVMLNEGWATLTPLKVDTTDYASMDRLASMVGSQIDLS